MPSNSINRIPAAIRAALVNADVEAGTRTRKTAQRYYQRIGTVTGTQTRGVGKIGLARLKVLYKTEEYKQAVSTVIKQDKQQKRIKQADRKLIPEMDYIREVKGNPETSDRVAIILERDYDDTTGVLFHHGQYYLTDRLSRGKAREEAIDLSHSFFSGEAYERLKEGYLPEQVEVVFVAAILRPAGTYVETIKKNKRSDSGTRKIELREEHYVVTVYLWKELS